MFTKGDPIYYYDLAGRRHTRYFVQYFANGPDLEGKYYDCYVSKYLSSELSMGHLEMMCSYSLHINLIRNVLIESMEHMPIPPVLIRKPRRRVIRRA